MSNAPPSIDPADLDNLTGAFRNVFNKMMQQISGVMPAKVIAFDRTTGRVQVQPLIKIINTNGEQFSRAQLASVPVVQLGGGGFLINFNINEGDLGFLMANDRDISLFLQSYSEAAPNTNRIKDFADAIFLPAVLTGYTIAGDDATNMVLQNLDGSVKIAMGQTTIKLSAPTQIELDSNVLVTGSLTVDGALGANGGVTVTSSAPQSTTITGNVFVTGDISATGNITPHV